MFFMLFLAFYGQILQTNLFPSFSFISTNVFLDDFVFLIVRRNYRPLRRLNANWPFFPPPATLCPPPADHICLKLACEEGRGVKWPPPRVRSFFRWGPFRPMQIEQKMISPRWYFHTNWKFQTWARDATILPLQRGHVFRPQSCLVIAILIYLLWLLHLDMWPRPNYFSNFFCSLRLYCVVALSLSRSQAIVACPALPRIVDFTCVKQYLVMYYTYIEIWSRDRSAR